ncbi:MAG: GH92 family glycosyl hydrolase [Cyclobacteriaceae bacterium]
MIRNSLKLLITSAILGWFVSEKSLAQEYIDYVNPFIGTSNYGATHPGPNYPHGMISISPFNVAHKKGEGNKHEMDLEWNSRTYIQENQFLTGYSHVNLSGVGCPDLGSILLMPTTGQLDFNSENYGSTYSDEVAKPGYYSNVLNKYKIKVETTSTTRTGISKYIFPGGESNILLNLGLGLTNETGAYLKILSPTKIEGYKTIGTFCYHSEDVRPVYFAFELSKAPKNFGAWKKMPKYKAVEADWVGYNDAFKPYEGYLHPLSGDNIGAYFTFETEDNENIFVKVAISYVSTENAWMNLEKEQPEFDFDQTAEANSNKWNELLSRIDIESDNLDAKTIFYTALYHTLIHPNIINDVNGEYPLMGKYGIGNTDKNRFSVFSLWDTYRNVHPLLSLVYPEIQSQMVNSMVEMYDESGWLPKWELIGMETEVMVGDPASPVITDTYLRGITDFDVNKAYEAMKKSSDNPASNNLIRPGIDIYNAKGYVHEDTTDQRGGSVSTSLEYYIADWNLGQLAKKLGKKSDFDKYNTKSLGYKKLYDPTTGMLRPRMQDGSWLAPFDPEAGKNFEATPGYVEGNAWQYRFYVPHDINGVIKLVGGKRKFVNQLDMLFETDNYDMANEPDITYPYLYNYVQGSEWKSQKQVTELLNKYYHNTPAGIPGNDDTGALSTWAIFSMLGIYPVCPGDMNYAVSLPYFDKITISLNQKYYSGQKLIIQKNSALKKGEYARQVLFNGKPSRSFFINHADLTKGGVLNIN